MTQISNKQDDYPPDTERDNSALKSENRDSKQGEKGSTDQIVFSIAGHAVTAKDAFRFVALILVLALLVFVAWLLAPLIKEVFEPGGLDRVIADVQSAGPLGVFVLLGFQLVQVVVAFIPGEVVQLAAGMMYGPWLGALIILVGCILSSALIFLLVRKLGAPFVQDLVSTEHLEKFRDFEKSGKLDLIVFVLFLIPGMPKDVFSYLVPLTSMPLRRYLIITNFARIPGILLSTFGISSLMSGNVGIAIAVFAVAAVVGIVAILKQKQIMNFFDRKAKKDSGER